MSRAVARLCSLPLILFFVGYNVRGENACPSVPLLPHGFDCPFQNEKVKGCLRQFFSMLPIADPQAEAHGSIEKNKPLTISFFHFQSHPRGSKLHCISGEIHARIYPLDKWLSLCYIMCSGYIASSPVFISQIALSDVNISVVLLCSVIPYDFSIFFGKP